MNTMDTDVRIFADRLGKLERQNRFWKVGGLLAAAAFVFSLVADVRAQDNMPNLGRSTIVAQDFQLKDAKGVVRGELSVVNGQAKLDLFSSDGKVLWSTNPRMVIRESR